MNYKPLLLILISFCNSLLLSAQTKREFLHPVDANRMKTWWFFGYENTTKEGITADVEALKSAGFGGVVYYDQNHRGSLKGTQLGTPDDGFSSQWWDNLKFACKEANRVGLSFEVNISNGYCAGGKWIDPKHAMQRVQSARLKVKAGQHVSIRIPVIKGPDNYVSDIAILAFPVVRPHAECLDKEPVMRHFSARYNAEGKGRNGAMQKPDVNLPLSQTTQSFSGYGWIDVPDIGTLQVSYDSTNWCDVIPITPMYRSQGGYFYRTNAFPATKGRYWRVNYTGKARLREWSVGAEAMFDRWEERTGLQSDFADDSLTPVYGHDEIIDSNDVIDLSRFVHDGILDWTAPVLRNKTGDEASEGEWQIVRLASVLTGAKSKHGRQNLLGYECDKLSVEAAELHWNSYTQVIIDTLKALDADCNSANAVHYLTGVTMDSHEGGAQNWTPLMLHEFESRRGYSLTPYLLMLAGYVVDSKEKTEQVLYDFRHTISDCIRDNYFGTFQRLARSNGLTFTAQAIGNALCIDGDAISVKKIVDKPQGEFWTYQKDGAYDVKDCTSACHLYGKSIASAEAMTDAVYASNPEDLKRVADIAFSMGAQEFVVCATPHIPYTEKAVQDSSIENSHPYIAGREYAINRTNPKWEEMKPVWETSARSAYMLRQGNAAPDALIFLGDDVPIKTLTNRLPDCIEGLDWDVCTGDALQRVSDSLCSPEGIRYKALVLGKQAHISPSSQAKIDSISKAGIPVLTSGESIARSIIIKGVDGTELDSRTIVHTHRKVEDKDMFFLANITDAPVMINVQCLSIKSDASYKRFIWRTSSGKTQKLKAVGDELYTIMLEANESVFIF